MDELRKEFEDAALQYMGAIYSTALRMTKNKTEAADLVQDTYLRAYRFFDKFEHGTSMKAWLFKILRNIAINKFRKQATIPEHIDLGGIRSSGQEPVSLNNPEEELLYKLLYDEFECAVDAMPEKFRHVILLSDVQGFSYREIADIAGCPIGTVMSRLCRARKFLRSSLCEYARELDRNVVEMSEIESM